MRSTKQAQSALAPEESFALAQSAEADTPGIRPATASPSAPSVLAALPQRAPILPQKLPLPLAFEESDAKVTGLTKTQVDGLTSLREGFVRQVGENQNAYDARYAERWRQAVPSNDARLRLLFGSQYADKAQLQATQAAYAAAARR